MENKQALILGATQSFYSLTGAIRSRTFVFELKPLEEKHLLQLLEKLYEQEGIEMSKTI